MPEGRPVLKVHRYFHKKITNKTDEWNKKRNDNEDSHEDWEAAHMKLIKTVDAEGAVLCHDITQIIRGVTKDAVFRKGHIVTKEDIPVLLSVGKDTLYVWEKEEGMMHEDEAAEVLCEICRGEHMDRSLPKPELFARISASIDRRIHSNYRIYSGNYVAYDWLNGSTTFAANYTEEEKLRFINYIDQQLAKINIPNKDEDFLREKLLLMYSNPLVNYLAACR